MTEPRATDPVRIVVVENSWAWMGAVAHQVSTTAGFALVGTAGSVADALALVERERPRLALVDLHLEGESGLQVARVLRAKESETQVVIMTLNPYPGAVREARELGVAGFVLKDDLPTRATFVRLLGRLSRGERVFSAGALKFESDSDDPALVAAARYGLTDRDRELIACFAEGLTTAEMQRHTHLGAQTIRNYTRAIGAKMEVSGRLEIVVKAIREGILAPPSRSSGGAE